MGSSNDDPGFDGENGHSADVLRVQPFGAKRADPGVAVSGVGEIECGLEGT